MPVSRSKKVPTEPWWHVAGLLSGVAFAIMLAYARLLPGALDDIDAIITPHLVLLQSFGWTEVFVAITTLGGLAGIGLVGLGTAYFLRHSRRSIVRLICLLAGAGLSVEIAKSFVERSRPDALSWLSSLTSFSFPSGHATLSMALYGFIGVSLYRRAVTLSGRIVAIIVPSLILFMVGFSRMVLSFHYFTDVIAGFLLGFFWLSVAYMLPRAVTSVGK